MSPPIIISGNVYESTHFFILFYYYFFFMSMCACTCGAFSLHYFPRTAKRGEGELLSPISGFAYVMTF